MIPDKALEGLPSVAWRSESTLMTETDTLTVLREATDKGLLGKGVTFYVTTPWGITSAFTDNEIIFSVLRDGVRLMAEPVPFKGKLVPSRNLAGMAAVRHVVDAAEAALTAAVTAYDTAKGA